MTWLVLQYIVYSLSLLIYSVNAEMGPLIVAPGVKTLPASVEDSGDAGSSPGSERPPGVGIGNPLQCSFLEDSLGRLAGHSPWDHKELDITAHRHMQNICKL